MKSIVRTFYSEELANQIPYTGLVYELEDGTYVVTAQEGSVKPAMVCTYQELLKAQQGK